MLQIKKPFWLYLIYSFLVLTWILEAIEEPTFLFKLLWTAIACLAGVYLVGLLRTKTYLEFKNETIYIHTDFFKTKCIPAGKIRKAVLDLRPFRPSKFILEDGSVIKFNSHLAPLDTYRNFLTQLNIPVEG